MACNCCQAPNGQTLILEIVTMSIASFFLLCEICLGRYNVLSILYILVLVIPSVLSIVALKIPRYTRLGGVTVVFAIFGFVLHVVLLILSLLTLPVIINNLEKESQNTYFLQHDVPTGRFLIFSLIFAYACIAFGIGSCLAIAIKHAKIRKQKSSKSRPSWGQGLPSHLVLQDSSTTPVSPPAMTVKHEIANEEETAINN